MVDEKKISEHTGASLSSNIRATFLNEFSLKEVFKIYIESQYVSFPRERRLCLTFFQFISQTLLSRSSHDEWERRLKATPKWKKKNHRRASNNKKCNVIFFSLICTAAQYFLD